LESPVRWVVIAIVAYVCIVLEALFFRAGLLAIRIDGQWIRPDLLLILGLFLALHLESHEVFVVGWCFGLASDLVSVAGRLGVGALLFCLVLYLISLLRKGVFGTRVLAQFLLCLGAVFLVHGVWYVATRYFEAAPLRIGPSAEQAGLEALYSAFLAPYLFWLFAMLRGPLRLPVGAPE
jgi:rod shape-determining protein MreD